MKKIYYPLACCLIGGMLASCGGGAKKSNATEEATAPTTTAVSYSKSLKAPETDSLNLPIDADGYITIFDGKSLDGWRGYGKDKVPSRWIIEDGCLKFCGTGTGEGQTGEGGDLIFAHKFKNFELELEWKISKGGNSGIFYLAQEVTSKDKDGNEVLEPIYISAPEFQVLDNANHPDAKLGKDNNRQAASLIQEISDLLFFFYGHLHFKWCSQLCLCSVQEQNGLLYFCLIAEFPEQIKRILAETILHDGLLYLLRFILLIS